MTNRSLRDVGGTSGGLLDFVIGLVMVCGGGYLLTNQVTVASSYWSFYGASFGITLIPMLAGIAIIFWSGRNVIGWLLALGGAVFILAGVIANLHIYFQPTSLFNTLVMFILLFGGLGMIMRSIRPQRVR